MIDRPMNTLNNEIIPLAEKAGFLVGAKLNTLLFNETGEKSMRHITDVQVRREYGKDWLVVRWDRAGQTPWGTADCGFAGWLIDEQLKKNLMDLAQKRDGGVQ